LARIGAKSAAARAFCDFFGNQRNRPIQSDVEHLVASFKAGIGLLLFDERAEAAKPSGDGLAALGVHADFTRQQQQFQSQIQFDVGRRHILRNARAFWLFALLVILLLAKLDVGSETPGLHHHVKSGYRILAEDAIGAGFAIGREWTSIAALRIIRAADKRAEFPGLEVEPPGPAARALSRIAAVLAGRVDVRPQHIVKSIKHLGDTKILDLVCRLLLEKKNTNDQSCGDVLTVRPAVLRG